MGRLQATCGARRSGVPCKQLRAFASVCAVTSVCEQVRARQVAFSRVWSRLVAFSRANFFFVFGHVRARLGVFFRHFSSFLVILRHSSSQNGFFRVWRARGGCGIVWAGRAAVCCAWLPRRGQDGQIGMVFVRNRYTVAAGPRLRSFMFSTNVLQNRGGCSCWESQGASQNGGGFLSCFEGQDSRQLSELWFRRSV